jgi:hypothetical protein
VETSGHFVPCPVNFVLFDRSVHCGRWSCDQWNNGWINLDVSSSSHGDRNFELSFLSKPGRMLSSRTSWDEAIHYWRDKRNGLGDPRSTLTSVLDVPVLFKRVQLRGSRDCLWRRVDHPEHGQWRQQLGLSELTSERWIAQFSCLSANGLLRCGRNKFRLDPICNSNIRQWQHLDVWIRT